MVITNSRIRSKSPVPVTDTLDVSILPSIKSTLLEPVTTTSFVVLANAESVIVNSWLPAVSRPTSFPARVIPSNTTFLLVRGPYLYAAPALFVMVPERSPPKFLT